MPQAGLLHVHPSEPPQKFAGVVTGSVEDSTEVDELDDLLALTEDHEDAFEIWMREVAVPEYQRFLADPSIGIPFEEVEAELDRDLEEIFKGR